jgi:hypothetical protein
MKRDPLVGKSCPRPGAEPKKVLTRIYIEPSGDLVVTDLWDEIRQVLGDGDGSTTEPGEGTEPAR